MKGSKVRSKRVEITEPVYFKAKRLPNFYVVVIGGGECGLRSIAVCRHPDGIWAHIAILNKKIV